MTLALGQKIGNQARMSHLLWQQSFLKYFAQAPKESSVHRKQKTQPQHQVLDACHNSFWVFLEYF
jgi:hypothetical protein